MAFTEFYCQTTGSNLNSGSTASDSATYTGVGDSDGTSKFTPSDGSTPASSVNVGDFASIYVTAGATVATFVGRVTAVAAGVNGAITVSTTAKSGTIPANSAGAHTITCKVGGAWQGPNGAVNFPFNFVTSTLTDFGGDLARVNLKNNATYSVTAAITHANANVIFQGYSSAGDGGKATIDGGTSGASYVLFTVATSFCGLFDLIFSNNGASGSADGVQLTGGRNYVSGCVFHDFRGAGLNVSGAGSLLVACEAYACNKSNTGSLGGFVVSITALFRECISHGHSAGSNCHGFVASTITTSTASFHHCIADTCAGKGFTFTSTGTYNLENCDAYNNTSDGVLASSTGQLYLENCLLVSNGGYGVHATGTLSQQAAVNCAFYNNTSGQTNGLNASLVTGSITLTGDPFTDAANGDFRLNNTAGAGAACRGAGRGTFTQTAASYSGTVGYPDVGAVQHQDAGGGGGGIVTQRHWLGGLT